ncbi:hypothetical protein GOODEAATRI_017663 [Goodea atripinnis]|uniref:Uncharacterized protein n=1 Tax=Goodea atripinnis TaxID=208336 RepID=A0ABV0NEQ5_9TELE
MFTSWLAPLMDSTYVGAASSSDDSSNGSSSKCRHLMFDDSFYPVAIFITARPLSSPAGEQSHGVSYPHRDFLQANVPVLLHGANLLLLPAADFTAFNYTNPVHIHFNN